ncbi:MAG: FtsX-like permease family protein, partial [Acidobacteriota bacterium]
GTLVSVQIALSVCLLAGAGLFVRSLQNLKNVELGFRRENLLLVNVAPRSNYDAARRTALSKSVLADLSALPGVQSVTFGIGGQFTGTNARVRFQIHVDGFDPPAGDSGDASLLFVGPRYLETMGIALTAGRDFGEADMVPKPGQPPAPWVAPPANAGAALPQGVVIVDESLAKKYFGTNEAVGHVIRVGNGTQANRIIGVAKNIKYDTLREVASPEIFFPYSTVGVFGYSFQLHTAGNPLALATSMQAAIKRIDPNVNVTIRTEADVIDAMTSTERMIARFSGGFSLFALGLACLGLYGVLSYNVAQRTREIGVRMALGAQVSAIARLVVKQGVVLAAIGCVFGVAAAIALSRYVTSTFYGVSGADPVTLAVVVVLLIAVALVASWLPARRATRINPITALRSE